MKWSNLTKSQQEQLKQIFSQGMVWDGNLISQLDANDLTDMGFLTKTEGYFFLERLPEDFHENHKKLNF